MSQQLTLELSDSLYNLLQEKARASGQSLSDWLILSLQQQYDLHEDSNELSNLIIQDAEYPIWSPYNAHEAAAVMLDVLRETESKTNE